MRRVLGHGESPNCMPRTASRTAVQPSSGDMGGEFRLQHGQAPATWSADWQHRPAPRQSRPAVQLSSTDEVGLQSGPARRCVGRGGA
eukprot:1399251-Prymnesium_polylepis.1